MKKILAAALAASTLLATPAFAQDAAPATFTGARVGGTIGFADDDFGGTQAFTYGVEAGYDFDLGGAVAGVTLEAQDSGEDGIGRDLSAVGRVGGKAGDRVLLYALGGYTNLRVLSSTNLDGFRVGGGVEVAATRNLYVKAEYRYSNYELDVEAYQGVVGVGFRF